MRQLKLTGFAIGLLCLASSQTSHASSLTQGQQDARKMERKIKLAKNRSYFVSVKCSLVDPQDSQLGATVVVSSAWTKLSVPAKQKAAVELFRLWNSTWRKSEYDSALLRIRDVKGRTLTPFPNSQHLVGGSWMSSEVADEYDENHR